MLLGKFIQLDEAEETVWERVGRKTDLQLNPLWHAVAEGELEGWYFLEEDHTQRVFDRRSAYKLKIWHPHRDKPPSGDGWVPSTLIKFERADIDRLWPDPKAIEGKEKGKGGRPSLPWDDFFIEVVRLASHPDGLPETQAELERTMLDWCETHWAKSVGESTVRTKVSAIYRALRGNANK